MTALSAEERDGLAEELHPDKGVTAVDTGTVRRLLAQVEALEQEQDRYRLALEGLTPGGSEFHRDPERCVAEIQRQKDCVWRFATQTKKELSALEQALSIPPEEAGRILHDAWCSRGWTALTEHKRRDYAKRAAALLAELRERAGMGE